MSLLVAAVVGGGAAGAMALSGRAPDIKPDALSAAVQAGVLAPIRSMSVVSGGDAPWGPGDAVQLWLTAGQPADLYLMRARQVGDAISLLGPARRISTTPFADERILLARPEAVLVALGDDAVTRVVALHGPTAPTGAVYLGEGTRAVKATWTSAGFALQTDAGPVTVDVQAQTVSPASAGRWLPLSQPPAHPMMEGVEDTAAPSEWTRVSGEMQTRNGVQMTPYDSRAVALRYVPGIAQPGGVHGRPGDGVGPADALAWLPAPEGGGAASAGALIAPLERGGAAIAIDVTGRARMGIFAGEPTAPRDGVLRQAGPPLVLDGKPVRVAPDSAIARRGLGVTADGWIIVARGEAITRLDLAIALAQAGADQAVALGAETVQDAPRADDAFALVRRQGLRAARWRAQNWTARDTQLATRQAGPVELALISTDAVQVRLVPGTAEVGGPDARAPQEGWCLSGGVRSDRAPYGLKIGAEMRRTPREGVLSLLIDVNGRATLGLAPTEIPTDMSVLQGPQLIRDRRAAIEDRRVEPGVLTAIGARADGRLVYAQTSANVGELVEALLAAGVVDAIRLGDVSAADGGRIVPANMLGVSEGTTLHLTPTPPPPAALPTNAIRAW